LLPKHNISDAFEEKKLEIETFLRKESLQFEIQSENAKDTIYLNENLKSLLVLLINNINFAGVIHDPKTNQAVSFRQ